MKNLRPVAVRCNLHWAVAILLALAVANALASEAYVRRPASVRDSIEMTNVGDILSRYMKKPVASFSPDGSHFVIVTSRGNIQNNSNESSILLFDSRDPIRSQHAVALATFSSATNTTAIASLRWAANGQSLLFLGTKDHEATQVYKLEILSRKLVRLTQHHTDVLAFSASWNQKIIAYLARPTEQPLVNESARRDGLLISDHQSLDELTRGHTIGANNEWPSQLFLETNGGKPERIGLSSSEKPLTEFMSDESMSPDGKYVGVVLGIRPDAIPDSWKKYEGMDGVLFYPSYNVVDTDTRQIRRLIDAPQDYPTWTPMRWFANSKEVIVAKSFLPLVAGNQGQEESRKGTTYTADVNVSTGTYEVIDEGQNGNADRQDIVAWDPVTCTLVLKPFRNDATPSSTYRKNGRNWSKIGVGEAKKSDHFQVRINQDLNAPPKIVSVAPDGTETVILDLNPAFETLEFGHVSEIDVKASDGHEVTAGLYRPVDYQVGNRYPLVIQTHGWAAGKGRTGEVKGRFLIDGSDLSGGGYAAQALAGAGIVVVQLPDIKEQNSSNEGPSSMALYQSVIDELDRQGEIDPRRVGLLGYSRTGFGVRYALAFSKYSFAAASLVDALDVGYMTYLVMLSDGLGQTYELVNGARPFGDGLNTWVKKDPTFNIDHVHTPVRQVYFNTHVLTEWEWFIASKNLQKPIEMIWLPDADHPAVKPSERVVTQQGNVDWFRFWLQGFVDSDPKKSEQYARWEKLCDMQRAANPDSPTFCVGTKH